MSFFGSSLNFETFNKKLKNILILNTTVIEFIVLLILSKWVYLNYKK